MDIKYVKGRKLYKCCRCKEMFKFDDFKLQTGICVKCTNKTNAKLDYLDWLAGG